MGEVILSRDAVCGRLCAVCVPIILIIRASIASQVQILSFFFEIDVQILSCTFGNVIKLSYCRPSNWNEYPYPWSWQGVGGDQGEHGWVGQN